MSPVEALSAAVATVGVLSWMSRRALKPAVLSAHVLTVILTLGLAGCGALLIGFRQWCADLSLLLDADGIFHFMIVPLLLFAPSACVGSRRSLRREARSLSGASLRVLLTAAFVGAAVKVTLADLIGWDQCLMFGIVVSSIDPLGVVRLLPRISCSTRPHRGELVNETLFTSALAAILLMAILKFSIQSESIGWMIGLVILLEAAGGVLLGLLAGWSAARALHGTVDHTSKALVILSLVAIACLTAVWAGMAGPLEAITSGITFRRCAQHPLRSQLEGAITPEFSIRTMIIQDSVLLLLLGIWVAANGLNATAAMAGLAALFGITLVRVGPAAISFFRQRTSFPGARVSPVSSAWVGFRGAIPIALAFSIPYAAGRAWILGATFVTIVLSLAVHAGTVGWLSRPCVTNTEPQELTQC